MITEDKKYMSEILKIGGFALTAPLGTVVLNLSNFEMFDLSPKTLWILLFLMLLFYFGILMLYKGYTIMKGSK